MNGSELFNSLSDVAKIELTEIFEKDRNHNKIEIIEKAINLLNAAEFSVASSVPALDSEFSYLVKKCHS